MSDETNETSEQQPVEETPEAQQDTPTEAPAPAEEQVETQPVAEEPQDEDAAVALAEDAATEDDTPAEEQAAAEEASAEPVAEAEAPAAPPEREEPKKEDKKDVIPGANLEPIAIEPQGRELSAEERAALEAEEEEKARREAELAAAESDSAVADRAPAKMESGARFLATGKRKSSIARVILLPGDGKITINGRELAEFFPRPLHQTMVKQPLTVSGYEGNVDVRVRVHGGGVSGQAGAVRHGIARALTEVDAELRGDLKRRGFLTRDARVKERRKAGFKKARKKPQFSKR
jgi:small subunit ribosomal protein S9